MRLECRAQLQHIVMVSKRDRAIPECEVYVGDGLSGSFYDCDYRNAGVCYGVEGVAPGQFNVFGIGNFVKLVFPRPPRREGKNLAGQVALGIVKIFAQPMAYYKGIVNEERPIIKGGAGDEVDRVLLEMGVPLQQPGLDWNFDSLEKSDQLTYAPVDEETRVTLKEVQQQWIKAHKVQDYEKLKHIGRDIKTLLNIGNEILRLKRELQACLLAEDFDRAIDIRNEIVRHQSKRENFEVMYETSRFEESLVMGAPSQKFQEEMMKIQLEELQRQDALRRKKEEFEAEQRRLRDEMERKRAEEKMKEEERSRLEFERQERELKEREEHERRMREAETDRARQQLEEAERRRREEEQAR